MAEITHILDTHAVIWALDDSPKLGRKARKVIAAAEWGELAISCMTLLELAMLIEKGRIDPHCSLGEALSQVEEEFIVLPLDGRVAEIAVTLTPFHGDLFDRAIVATANAHDLPLLTVDRDITRCGLVDVFWR